MLFVFMYVRKEAVLSSQIEGTQSSLQDLLAAEARILGSETPKDVDEVLNYVAAMKHGLHRHRVLEHLYEHPIVSVDDVRTFTGITWAAANDLVRRLVEHRVLVEVTGQRRHRRFRCDPYVRLFDEPQPAEGV